MCVDINIVGIENNLANRVHNILCFMLCLSSSLNMYHPYHHPDHYGASPSIGMNLWAFALLNEWQPKIRSDEMWHLSA